MSEQSLKMLELKFAKSLAWYWHFTFSKCNIVNKFLINYTTTTLISLFAMCSVHGNFSRFLCVHCFHLNLLHCLKYSIQCTARLYFVCNFVVKYSTALEGRQAAWMGERQEKVPNLGTAKKKLKEKWFSAYVSLKSISRCKVFDIFFLRNSCLP